jgi:hypothetical protein
MDELRFSRISEYSWSELAISNCLGENVCNTIKALKQLEIASSDHEYSEILENLSSSIKNVQKIMADARGVAAV